MRKVLAFLCCIFALIGAVPMHVHADEMVRMEDITVKSDDTKEYRAAIIRDKIYLAIDDISDIINMEIIDVEKGYLFDGGFEFQNIFVDLHGDVTFRNTRYKDLGKKVSKRTFYYPLEEFLYFSNCQWYIFKNIVVVENTTNTLVHFLEKYLGEIQKKQVTQNDILMNGESRLSMAAKGVFSKLFLDFDARIFVPFGSSLIIDDEYENAVLQLAVSDSEFVEKNASGKISSLLTDGLLGEASAYIGMADSVLGIPEIINTSANEINKVYSWLKSDRKNYWLFSDYKDISNLHIAELDALSKK